MQNFELKEMLRTKEKNNVYGLTLEQLDSSLDLNN